VAFSYIIALPTARGWRFGDCVWGPETNSMLQCTEFTFHMLNDPAGETIERIILAMRWGMFAFVPTHHDKATLAFRITAACAPHVLRTHANSPEQIPWLNDGRIDLEAWLKLGPGANASPDSLAEALDGGRTAYLGLCRQDVMRILMADYDASSDAGGMTTEAITVSPLKRRYYDEAVVRAMVAKMEAEGKIGSETVDGLVKVHILPQYADALRAEAAAAEARALQDAQSPEFQITFPRGRGYDAWRAIELILKAARDHVWIEDAFIDGEVVALLTSVPEQLPMRVLTRKLYEGADPAFRRLGQQRPGRLEVRTTAEIHGRRLFVDDRVWESSESIKELAAKTASTVKPLDSPDDVSGLRHDFEARWQASQRRYCNDKGGEASAATPDE